MHAPLSRAGLSSPSLSKEVFACQVSRSGTEPGRLKRGGSAPHLNWLDRRGRKRQGLAGVSVLWDSVGRTERGGEVSTPGRARLTSLEIVRVKG